MTDVTRRRLGLGCCFALAAATFLTGINWGLPSRAADPYLFGKREPWSGREILELAGGWEPEPGKGSDLDVDPLTGRDRVIALNDTDAKRAEIVRRYRLYSYHPDEMLTPRALSAIKPGQGKFDPLMYQYGGLWFYPVGAMLKIASAAGLVHVTGDVAYYLDHPEAFGRFYVVMRLYTALWALAGVWAVFEITRRAAGTGGGWLAPTAAAACYAALPVVVAMAHEAKPHLPATVLALFAVLAAERYARLGGARAVALAGAACGAAAGMALTGVATFLILPAMVLFRPGRWTKRIVTAAGACAVGALVYGATNPYVLIHLLRDPEVLRTQLANTAAMMPVGDPAQSLLDAPRLIAYAASAPVAIAGVFGIVVLAACWRRLGRAPQLMCVLLVAAAAPVLAQFVPRAADRPAEFARFALLPTIVLLMAAVLAATLARRPAVRALIYAGLFVSAAVPAARAVANYVRDSRDFTPRLAEAARLRELAAGGPIDVGVYAEPAPYSVPPVDLFRWNLALLPKGLRPMYDGERLPVDVLVEAADVLPNGGKGGTYLTGPGFVDQPSAVPGSWWPTPIPWAAKPFRVRVREGFPAARPAKGDVTILGLQHPSMSAPMP